MNCIILDGTRAAHVCVLNAPHPHVECRYLIVPGIQSSRMHIIDTKPDPRWPQIVKVIESETLAARAGCTSPHTIHCVRRVSSSARSERRTATAPAESF